VWVESTSSVGSKCVGVEISCDKIIEKAICEIRGGAIGSDGTAFECIWIYDSSDGEEGNCKKKDDMSLTCLDIKRKEQCEDANEYNSKLNCFWLEGNETVSSSCINEVCIIFV
jgi:hypothetical protein